MIYLLYSFLWWQIISITAISAGYHRYFSHRSFTAPVWYEYYVLILGSLTASGPLLGWVGVHRLHHRYSDTEKDPHSPKYKGIWRVLTSTFEVPAIKYSSVKDLINNPRVMVFYRYHNHIRIATFIVAAAILPVEWFLVLIVSPIIYGYIGFGLINAFCHDPVTGGAKNSHIVNILAGGDGFHKNHHDRPGNWKIGQKWYELDPGAWFIRLIRKENYGQEK